MPAALKKTVRPAASPVARLPRNAGDTRARILAAARVRFSRDAYENVGTRDIAADAGVDAALVNRYFGSKEKLFDEAIEDAFAIKDHFDAMDMRATSSASARKFGSISGAAIGSALASVMLPRLFGRSTQTWPE